MNKLINYHEKQVENKSETISVFFINDNNQPLNTLETQLEDFGYTVNILNSIEDFLSTISTLKEDLALNQNQTLYFFINTIFINDMTVKVIEYAKLHFEDDIHFIYYSDNNNISAHLQGIRNYGEAFLSTPLEASEIAEIITRQCKKNKSPYRILFIDDDESIGTYYRNVFNKAGIICQHISNIDNVLNIITEFKPDLLLIDYYMPECSGFELAKILRQRINIELIPIVYLSSETDPVIHLKSISDGVDDFLDKSTKSFFIINNLKSRIKRARSLRSLIMQDSLTQLYNHAMLEEHLDLEIYRSFRNSSEFCYVMIDLDNFKSINDQYGHIIGDKVIKTLSVFLKQNLRQTDIIGRYGGEEFGIILPDTTIEKAYAIINTLREKFSEIMHSSESKVFLVTFSAGISSFPEKINRLEIIEEADQYLYQAKDAGRNLVYPIK